MLPLSSPTEIRDIPHCNLHPAGARRDRGGGGGAPALRISHRKGSFLRPLHVCDFVKEGYFFVPRYEEWGLKIPLRNLRDSDA